MKWKSPDTGTIYDVFDGKLIPMSKERDSLFAEGRIWLEVGFGRYYNGTGIGFRIYKHHFEVWFPFKKALSICFHEKTN